jgi:hypothetical protein
VKDLAEKVNAKIQFNIIDFPTDSILRAWQVDMMSPHTVTINELNPAEAEAVGSSSKPSDGKKVHVTISSSDETFRSLMTGQLSPESAYMRGLMRIKGPLGVALRVKALLKFAAKIAATTEETDRQ